MRLRWLCLPRLAATTIKPNTILSGDALTHLKSFPDSVIDCVMTSPPYWNLRDYDVAGQLGLEPNIEEHMARLCGVFDEVRRVLKPSGTCWVNLADSFAAKTAMRNEGFNKRWHGKKYAGQKQAATDKARPLRKTPNVREKSLCLIPFRFAIEMVNRRWILRNVIVWQKPNCMPSSAKDRFTIDFEFLFFFTKSKKYFFDVQFEPHSEVTKRRVHNFIKNGERFDPRRHKFHSSSGQIPYQVLERIARNGLHPLGRNKRCVWSIPTQAFFGAHYATYPEALCEIPIRAGCPEAICSKCGKPRKKIPGREQGSSAGSAGYTNCSCERPWTPGIVLDPFLGAGTTSAGRPQTQASIHRHRTESGLYQNCPEPACCI